MNCGRDLTVAPGKQGRSPRTVQARRGGPVGGGCCRCCLPGKRNLFAGDCTTAHSVQTGAGIARVPGRTAKVAARANGQVSCLTGEGCGAFLLGSGKACTAPKPEHIATVILPPSELSTGMKPAGTSARARIPTNRARQIALCAICVRLARRRPMMMHDLMRAVTCMWSAGPCSSGRRR